MAVALEWRDSGSFPPFPSDGITETDLLHGGSVRYRVRVIDVPNNTQNGQCAVFIVPQGREHEWMFTSAEGLRQVSDSAGYGRLIVIYMQRGELYSSLHEVQKELNSKVLALIPRIAQSQVPYLSTGGIGNRVSVATVESQLTGRILIDDVENGEMWVRRLSFDSNENLVQSEALLVKDTHGKVVGIDPGFLASDYQTAVIAAVALALTTTIAGESTIRLPVLAIGLGSGTIAAFLSHFLPSLVVTTVELDPVVVEVAQKYFFLDDTVRVVVGDGILAIAERAASETIEEKPALLIIDVDSKDTTTGMSCPAASFASAEFFQSCRRALRVNAACVFNVVCRSTERYGRFKEELFGVFTTGFEIPTDDVNRVVIAFNYDAGADKKTAVLKLVRALAHPWKGLVKLKTLVDGASLVSVTDGANVGGGHKPTTH